MCTQLRIFEEPTYYILNMNTTIKQKSIEKKPHKLLHMPLRLHFTALHVMGLWPSEATPGIKGALVRVANLAYTTGIILLFGLLYIGLELIGIWTVWGNLSSLTENVCICATHIAGMLKMFNLFRNRRRVLDCLWLLHNMADFSGARNRPNLQKIENGVVKAAQRQALFITASFISLVSLTAVAAMYYHIYDRSALGHKFPFVMWIPPNIPFVYSWLYCSFGLTWNGIAIAFIDTLLMAFMIHICAQIQILQDCLKSLGCESVDRKNGDVGDNDLQPAANQNIVNAQLVNCVQHHQAIIKLCSEVETIFSGMVLLQLLTSLMIIGLTGFQVVVNLHDATGHLPTFGYLGCVISEILIYCWFGNQIIIESSNIGNSACESAWPTAGPFFSKTLLSLVERSKRPLQLTAGGFGELSLEMFTWILSRSYSYMAVLRQLYESAG